MKGSRFQCWNPYKCYLSKWDNWELPGSLMVKTQCFNAGDVGSIPAQGTRISHPSQCSQKKKKT